MLLWIVNVIKYDVFPVSETLKFTINGIVRVVILIASNSLILKYNLIFAILDGFISQLEFLPLFQLLVFLTLTVLLGLLIS